MFNPIKFILNSVLSWVLLIAVVGGGYFVYLQIQTSKYNPEGVVNIFTELVKNPTDVISSGDNSKIDSIIDTQVLSSSKIEDVVLALRKVDQTLPVSLANIESNKPFSTATLIFGTQQATTPTIKLFMEETGEWYTGIKNKIFHIELLNFESLKDIKLDATLLDTITDITKSLGENLDKIKGGYGNDVVNDILKEQTNK
jgi:hypothetical protein